MRGEVASRLYRQRQAQMSTTAWRTIRSRPTTPSFWGSNPPRIGHVCCAAEGGRNPLTPRAHQSVTGCTRSEAAGARTWDFCWWLYAEIGPSAGKVRWAARELGPKRVILLFILLCFFLILEVQFKFKFKPCGRFALRLTV